MLLSGIIFVSLSYQSNRKTMFKKTDPNPQLNMFTAPSMQLGSRASKKYSDPNAWHNQFYSLVTTKIDEDIFKPLFPEGKKNGRPNASIRILVAMSVLKEGFGCSDEHVRLPSSPQSWKSGQRYIWKRIPQRPFTVQTLNRFRAILL